VGLSSSLRGHVFPIVFQEGNRQASVQCRRCGKYVDEVFRGPGVISPCESDIAAPDERGDLAVLQPVVDAAAPFLDGRPI
jgi:hypothetical protein